MGKTLVVNPGSSSRKYALYCDGKQVLETRFEDLKSGFEMCSHLAGTQQVCESISETDFSDSFAKVYDDVDKYLFRAGLGKLDSVVIRVVAPGTYFQKNSVIDEKYLNKLKECELVAPLHVPTILREIQSAKKHIKDVQMIAASDSAFHSQMPVYARQYSINSEDSEDFDIHRFGYHGLSVASVVRRIHSVIGIDPERMIVCHIGSGTSVTAVKNGKSVETSMGFSPTSGLPMSSRAGDLDATALLELMRLKHWRPRDAEVYINTNGGLAGLSGESDIRRLLDRRVQKDKKAILALDKFSYSIQKEIAAQTVSLGGVDALVLTATAAVRSNELRSLVMSRLGHLGMQISEDRNSALVGKDGVISVRNSPVKVVVMRTDEMGEMAQVATQFSQKLGKG